MNAICNGSNEECNLHTSQTESPRKASAVAFQFALTSFPSRWGTGGRIGFSTDDQIIINT